MMIGCRCSFSSRNSQPSDWVTFMRLDEKAEFVVVINFSNRPVAGSIEVQNAEEFRPVRLAGVADPVSNGFPQLKLRGFEWRIYQRTLGN